MPVKSRIDTVPLRVIPRGEDGVERPAQVLHLPPAEVPAALLMMQLPKPGILFDPPRDQVTTDFWTYSFDDLSKLKKTYPKSMVMMGFINLNAYARFFSKIAYSYACAVMGVDGFEPLILERIIGEEEPNDFLFVGGPEGQSQLPGDVEGDHAIALRHENGFLLADVVIFAPLGAPVHTVVIGKLKAST
jgi:hypothetical protein